MDLRATFALMGAFMSSGETAICRSATFEKYLFLYNFHNTISVRTFGADSLTVFKKKLLRRVLRSKGDEMTRGSGKLHNEELHNL
jgi:hypothetical protein